MFSFTLRLWLHPVAANNAQEAIAGEKPQARWNKGAVRKSVQQYYNRWPMRVQSFLN